MITQDHLKEILDYNPETGSFTWLVKAASRIHIGEEAGRISRAKNGTGNPYRKIQISGKEYGAHRLAFLYMEGFIPRVVDHINGDSLGNRWSNLRNSSYSMSNKNKIKSSNNTSGVTGVYFNKNTGKWFASIGVNGKTKHLGTFESKELAASARLKAESAHKFSERHGK